MLQIQGDTADLIQRVRDEVDVQRLIPSDTATDEFGRYRRQRCIHPDHKDSEPSLLVFQDGVNCTACGWRGDALDVYALQRPSLSLRERAQELLSGDWKVDPDEIKRERALRELDPGLAARYHFALAARPETLALVEAMGFSRASIRRWQLGCADVRVRVARDPDIWETQLRISVPVFQGGKLRQVIYRRSCDSQGGGKTTQEADAGSYLFNRDALIGADTAVVCEGWGDSIVLAQWGIVGVCSTAGAGHWNSEWNDALGTVRRLYVVGDADKAGARLVDRVRKALPWAKPIELPYELGSKKDIRDYLLDGHTGDDFKRLMKQADIRAMAQGAIKCLPTLSTGPKKSSGLSRTFQVSSTQQ